MPSGATKVRATDLIGTKVDYVRVNGGNNAGHTVVVGDESYALHLPSGIISPERDPVISNGVVVDPEVLFQEIDSLSVAGLSETCW